MSNNNLVGDTLSAIKLVLEEVVSKYPDDGDAQYLLDKINSDPYGGPVNVGAYSPVLVKQAQMVAKRYADKDNNVKEMWNGPVAELVTLVDNGVDGEQYTQLRKQEFQAMKEEQAKAGWKSDELVTNPTTGAKFWRTTDMQGQEVLVPEHKYEEFIRSQSDKAFVQNGGKAEDTLDLSTLKTK